MPQEALKGRKRKSFLNCGNRKGVTQHVGTNRTADPGALGNALDDALDGALSHAKPLVEREVRLDQRSYPPLTPA